MVLTPTCGVEESRSEIELALMRTSNVASLIVFAQ